MNEATRHTFEGDDGVTLVFHELGIGRPVVLAHGYTLNGLANRVDTGIAGRLADEGFRVIMPDMCGHGAGPKPHDRLHRVPGDHLGALMSGELREEIVRFLGS